MPLFVRTLLVTGPAADVAGASERHREQLRGLHAEGKLRFAGEFANGDGFIEILQVADLLEAERLTRASPLIEDGLAAWMLRELKEGVTS